MHAHCTPASELRLLLQIVGDHRRRSATFRGLCTSVEVAQPIHAHSQNNRQASVLAPHAVSPCTSRKPTACVYMPPPFQKPLVFPAAPPTPQPGRLGDNIPTRGRQHLNARPTTSQCAADNIPLRGRQHPNARPVNLPRSTRTGLQVCATRAARPCGFHASVYSTLYKLYIVHSCLSQTCQCCKVAQQPAALHLPTGLAGSQPAARPGHD